LETTCLASVLARARDPQGVNLQRDRIYAPYATSMAGRRMSKEMREIHEQILDRFRERRARESPARPR
jgi:hypothetical protein